MKTYEEIQKELDKHRVDEWHSVIPLSEDGSCLLDDLAEVGHPSIPFGVNGLTLHDTMSIHPKDAYTSRAYSILYEDADYIYNILTVESGDPHAGHLAQITRHDKQKHIVTREEWENSYTCG
jgi:hypothetical protein|tara:strand:+ start:1409 stop:1774 length:366 start_codon:yes stop_codon:yes gene_type:complete